MNEEMMNNEVNVNEDDYAVAMPDQAGDDATIGKGEIALVALAAVGLGFLGKKAFDLGKAGVGKVKTFFANKKASKESKDEPAETETVEGEVVDN
jgi:hypothetical protein